MTSNYTPTTPPGHSMLVNGVTYQPLTSKEREKHIRDIYERKIKVEQYIISLDTQSDYIDAMARCMESFEFWCDHFCWTFDPRDKRNPSKRFILYEFQRVKAREILAAIKNNQDIHLDKSRDMGASWLMMAIITRQWLFEHSFHAHMGSRVERLVDDSTVDSLFGKIDYILERLPHWMLQGYTAKNRKMLKMEGPRKNLITGESANKNFGRGPRKNLVYLDEFAFWEHDRAVWTSVADTAPCRVVTSTPFGEGNEFARLKFDTKEEIKRLTMHWTDHPYKDLEWYLKEKLNRTDIAVAQELDINYKASAGGLAIRGLKKYKDLILMDPLPIDDISHNGCSFHMGLDYGTTNPSSVHVYRVRPVSDKLHEIASIWEYYEPSDLYRISQAIKSCPYYGLITSIYSDPSMWYFNQHDPHGQRGVTSLAFLMKNLYGVHLTPGRRGDAYALEQLNEMTRDSKNILFRISRQCENQIREFENLRFETVSDRILHKKNESEKLVDKENHSWDDFKYFFNSYFDKPTYVPQNPSDTPMGYEALKKELSELKSKKLAALNKPRGLQRRTFRYR